MSIEATLNAILLALELDMLANLILAAAYSYVTWITMPVLKGFHKTRWEAVWKTSPRLARLLRPLHRVPKPQAEKRPTQLSLEDSPATSADVALSPEEALA